MWPISTGGESGHADVHVLHAMGFLRRFYSAPDQRLRSDDVARAATAAGLTHEAVLSFYVGQHAPLRRDNEWHVLTSSGKQWYLDNLAHWVSHSE